MTDRNIRVHKLSHQDGREEHLWVFLAFSLPEKWKVISKIHVFVPKAACVLSGQRAVWMQVDLMNLYLLSVIKSRPFLSWGSSFSTETHTQACSHSRLLNIVEKRLLPFPVSAPKYGDSRIPSTGFCSFTLKRQSFIRCTLLKKKKTETTKYLSLWGLLVSISLATWVPSEELARLLCVSSVKLQTRPDSTCCSLILFPVEVGPDSFLLCFLLYNLQYKGKRVEDLLNPPVENKIATTI